MPGKHKSSHTYVEMLQEAFNNFIELLSLFKPFPTGLKHYPPPYTQNKGSRQLFGEKKSEQHVYESGIGHGRKM